MMRRGRERGGGDRGHYSRIMIQVQSVVLGLRTYLVVRYDALGHTFAFDLQKLPMLDTLKRRLLVRSLNADFVIRSWTTRAEIRR